MHIKAIHGPKLKRAPKRSPNFTPAIEPSKRVKRAILNCEGIIDIDNSILLDSTYTDKSTPLEEEIVSGNIMNIVARNHEENMVDMKPLLSCDKCEFDCETNDALQEHISEVHMATDCKNCEFTSEEETVLKEHKSDCNLNNKNPCLAASSSNNMTDV